MDSFTENILARARQRQKLIETDKEVPRKGVDEKSSSEPNLRISSTKNLQKQSSDSALEIKDNEIKEDSPNQKTLNYQKDNLNMEIKVKSTDNVRIEVEIQERSDDEDEVVKETAGLREDAKNRLNRLGKLYAGGEDANISSPIHRTENNFQIEEAPKGTKQILRKGLNKLANLAQNINEWEDDITHKDRSTAVSTPKKTWKPPAPQPPKASPLKASVKPKAPSPPRNSPQKLKKNDDLNDKKENTKPLKWDKTVLDSLESQGFTRTESNTRLIYKYKNSQEKGEEQKPKSPIKTQCSAIIANKASLFESSPKARDPALLSVSERKALFEKNKGTALIPKAPFAMATPITKTPEKPKAKPLAPKPPKLIEKCEIEAFVPQASGIASKMAALLENKTTISQEQIENNTKTERQKEMDVLLNRFNRNKEVNNIVEEQEPIEESDDLDNINENTKMIKEKTVRIVEVAEKEKQKSGGKRFSKNDSPKVAAVLSEVKRIKVSPQKAGRLYPSISDIETGTETEDGNSPTPPNSSDGSFAESDDINTSFGRDILQVVCQNQTPQKRSILEESTASDISDILDDMDDYIDEALAYDDKSAGPTPPKQSKGPQTSDSFNYKCFSPQVNPKIQSDFQSPMKVTKPRQSDIFPTFVVDGENLLPLKHTVSFYRKQQASSSSSTPVRQITRPASIDEYAENLEETDISEKVQKKLIQLNEEVKKQEMTISQTSRALNLCNSTPEFMGSTEQVEAEKVLLLATHRRQASLHELQRLKVEKSLRPQSQHDNAMSGETGTLTIYKIVLPLKQKYVTALAAAGGKGHHVVCLLKCGEQVLPTQLVSTMATHAGKNSIDLELIIPGQIKLNDIYHDFTLTFEVYSLQAQEEILPHEIKYHINNKKTNKLITPKKNKHDSRLIRPAKESPAGPQAVRTSSFALMGYVVVSNKAIHKKSWTLNHTPLLSPFEGVVEMSISYELNVTVEHRGFLTMFEDISGFGAWHRRWCLLKGHCLSYWKYPDDERKMAPIDTIDLKNSITKQASPVSRDICARLHTFLIETERLAHPQDKDTLVMVRKGNKTIIRHLLSADTKEERIEWCNDFNIILSALHMCTYDKQ